jgi:phenylacetate-CoA ligase
MTYPNYFEALDTRELLNHYPIGDAFTSRYYTITRDELVARQNKDFLKVMSRGWQIPFYTRRWRSAGLEPGDIRSLDDITKLPTYDKSDLMDSIAKNPPFGDFSGLETWPAHQRPPAILHTTSGTTGKPQVLLFGAKGREVGNLLVARMARWQGLQPEDIVHSVYGHGMINGGHYIREAYIRFTNSIFLSAGTGIETRSAAQIQLMADFGVTVVVGFIDYIRKLADVARECGLTPGEHIKMRMIIGHLGTEDRRGVERAWGDAKAYDWYGVGDTGCIAGEGPDRDGLYVWEDAQYLELLDVDTHEPVIQGARGDMVLTCLYKDDIFPVIRFNTHDVTEYITTANSTGIIFNRIAGFQGRSDNMIKLRGINIFPHAIGAIIENQPSLTGEYVCRVIKDITGREDLSIILEARQDADATLIKELLRCGLGIDVRIEFVAPGQTAHLTQIETRQKPIRLIDERN